jgi:neutral/alkaline ceramidase-like enzyme
MPKSLRLVLLFVLASTSFCIAQNSSGPELRVGAASVDLALPQGVPLAGYGSTARRTFPYVHGYEYAKLFKPSIGTHDAVRAKSMVLISGNRKLLFISLDTAGITSEMYEDLLARLAPLGYQRDQVFAAATHTHGGPGTLSNRWLWQLLASDRFQDGVYTQVLERVVESAKSAEQNAQPAQLLALSFSAQGMQRNRRHRDGWFDPTANLLLAKSPSGAMLGAMVNFAVHGTALNAHNLQMSADLPGGIERELQVQLHAPVLFLNGAEGDVSPAESGYEGIEKLSRSFALQTMREIGHAKPIQPEWAVHNSTLELGDPAVTLGACLSESWHHRVGNWIVLGLGESVPRSITLTYLRLGDLRLLAWPGEPTTTLGFDLKRAAPGAWVLGLTNGYLGYFTSPGEFAEGRYEACSSLYGAQSGERIVKAFTDLIRANH